MRIVVAALALVVGLAMFSHGAAAPPPCKPPKICATATPTETTTPTATATPTPTPTPTPAPGEVTEWFVPHRSWFQYSGVITAGPIVVDIYDQTSTEWFHVAIAEACAQWSESPFGTYEYRCHLGAPGAIRAHVSTFDVTAARADTAAVRAALDAINLLLDTHGQVDSGALQITAGYPNPFLLTRGVPMSHQFVPLGGTAPYSFVWSGDTPAGLTLSPSGQLSGTPNAYGDKIADAAVTDAAGGIYGWSIWMRFAP